MKVGIPVWDGRVSPVLDAAGRLLVVEFEGWREVSRTTEVLGSEALPARAARLTGLGLATLVCGAVSRPLATMLVSAGIRVIPWITGPVDEVLRAWRDGELPSPRFQMPGCCGRGRMRGRGRGAGRGRGGRGAGRGGDLGAVTDEALPGGFGGGGGRGRGAGRGRGRGGGFDDGRTMGAGGGFVRVAGDGPRPGGVGHDAGGPRPADWREP